MMMMIVQIIVTRARDVSIRAPWRLSVPGVLVSHDLGPNQALFAHLTRSVFAQHQIRHYMPAVTPAAAECTRSSLDSIAMDTVARSTWPNWNQHVCKWTAHLSWMHSVDKQTEPSW